jgi:AraC-like DNA-binding protein
MTTLSEVLTSIPGERGAFALVTLHSGAHVAFSPAQRTFVHYVLDGTLTFEFEGANHIVSPGDFICFRQGHTHAMLTDSPGERHRTDVLETLSLAEEPSRLAFGNPRRNVEALVLSGALVRPRSDGIPTDWAMPQMVVTRAGNDRTSSIFPPAMVIPACSGAGAGAFAAALMQMLLFQSIRSEVYRRFGSTEFTNKFYRIGAALRLMERKYNENWTLVRLAKEAGMSRSAFCSEFYTAFGMAPYQKLIEIRLTEAQKLIAGGQPLAEVANAVGYRSFAAFSRAFRNRFGAPPTAFRPRAHGIAVN